MKVRCLCSVTLPRRTGPQPDGAFYGFERLYTAGSARRLLVSTCANSSWVLTDGFLYSYFKSVCPCSLHSSESMWCCLSENKTSWLPAFLIRGSLTSMVDALLKFQAIQRWLSHPLSTHLTLLGWTIFFWENDPVHPFDPRLRSLGAKAIPPGQSGSSGGTGSVQGRNTSFLIWTAKPLLTIVLMRGMTSLFFFPPRVFISILRIFPTSQPLCSLLTFVPCNFHQLVSFLSDVLKAQQKLIQSNTNFPVCCIIKCSAWCVHSPPVIKCQLQQCLVPPGSSCCHFHFPPRTKHLKTEKSSLRS